MSEKNANNVDQIRDLIFGNQIKDFEAKFTQLNHTLTVMEEKLNRSFSESHNKLQKETERALEVLEQKVDNLAMSTQRERSKLKELINTTDENLHDALLNQKDEFSTKLKMLKESVSDENQKMNQTLRLMQDEIQTTLEKGLESLSEEKLSRNTMAQMLLDVAMKIEGTEVSVSDMLVEEESAGK
jgi:small-conductance mechanosensitive channel